MVLLAVAGVGLAFGSFANVLIARVPAGEDWVRTPSHCPLCGHRIAWYDNVPVLSWLWLARRCRHCRQPISLRYPLVEMLVAGLFVATYLVHGVSLVSAVLAYLAVVSVALVFIDIDVSRLPDRLVLPLYPLVLASLIIDSATRGEWGHLLRAGIGLFIAGGFYGLMWVLYPAGLGFGDVKSAGVLGLAGGYLGWPQFAVGAISGPLLGGIAVLGGLAIGRLHRKSKVPYGPALIGGFWLGYLVGPAIASTYIDLLISG